MRIGIIYCCYGNPEYIDGCLSSWLEAKKTNDILISACCGQFKEYHNLGIPDNDIETPMKLGVLEAEKIIDHCYLQNWVDSSIELDLDKYQKIYETEAEIRDKSLQWLLKQDCDYIWLLDNDEFYTEEQINNIIKYIQKEEFITWFSIPFKNYVFDGGQWIDGFCPPRIFKVKLLSGELSRCYWDNDFEYSNEHDTLSYKLLSNRSIPKSVAHIKHLTWLHSNGKLKYEYQMKHFGHCGYLWNYETNKLEFNQEFHKKNNISIPEVRHD